MSEAPETPAERMQRMAKMATDQVAEAMLRRGGDPPPEFRMHLATIYAQLAAVAVSERIADELTSIGDELRDIRDTL